MKDQIVEWLSEAGQRPRSWIFPVVVVVVALLAAWPAIAQPGLLNTRGGGDSPFLLQRLHQLVSALTDGHFPVRWMPDANYGYGYPFYNYYAPLSIYIAAVFRFIGFSFVRSIHAAQLLGFIVAGLGMFYLGRRWLGSPWAGLLAAVAYTFAPFHMVNVYVRGDSLAEFWAMAFYPLVLLAADGLLDALESGRHAGIPLRQTVTVPLALFALAYAALILSHNISALIFSPFLLLYLILRIWLDRKDRILAVHDSPIAIPPSVTMSLLVVLGALVLAFGLAAWFFIPALAEQDLAQLGPVTEGYFRFDNHFRGFDLVQTDMVFEYSPDGGNAFRMGLVQAGLALAGGVVLMVAWRAAAVSRGRLAFILVGALVATLMITPLSRPLWENLPLLPFTQFPWRFLSVQALFIALLTGALALLPGRPSNAPLMAGLASLVLLAGGLLGLRTDHLMLTDADVTAERLGQYEWFTGNIGSTVSAEYLTAAAASPRPYTSAWLNSGKRDQVAVLSGSLVSASVARWSTRQEWSLAVDDAGATVQFPTLLWAGWRATIDGAPAELRTQPGSGLMIIDLPPGEHALTLILERTPVRLAAEWLSLIAFIVVVALLVGGRRPNVDRHGRRLLFFGIILVGLVVLAVIIRQRPVAELPDNDLTWDFAQMGYLHHDLTGVGFDNGARLYSYGYSHDELRGGETLTLTLSLAPGSGQQATLDLATPATARPRSSDVAEPPLLVSATKPLDDEGIFVFSLPIPTNAPAGLYIPRLTIDDARPLLPSGQTRGDLFLRPVRILPEDGVLAANRLFLSPAPDVPSELEVRILALVRRDLLTLDGQFAWFTDQPLPRRYQVSWRVQDGGGAVLSQLDTQPGYGFQPADGWTAGSDNHDWLALRLPETLSGPPPYTLVILLYDPVTGAPLLQRRLGEIVPEADGPVFRPIKPVFSPPVGLTPVNASFTAGDQTLIELHGYSLVETDGTLRLSLVWKAKAGMDRDFTRFVHLIDAATGEIVAQIDGHVAGNSYPTSQWLTCEVVKDVVEFQLPDGQPGQYRLATGFYEPVEGLPRLVTFGPNGLLPDNQVVLPAGITGD
jgi:hypothetical protein